MDSREVSSKFQAYDDSGSLFLASAQVLTINYSITSLGFIFIMYSPFQNKMSIPVFWISSLQRFRSCLRDSSDATACFYKVAIFNAISTLFHRSRLQFCCYILITMSLNMPSDKSLEQRWNRSQLLVHRNKFIFHYILSLISSFLSIVHWWRLINKTIV